MLRNLKVLGLAVVAILALGAVSSASAAEQYHSEGSSTTLTGSQIGTDVFTTNGGTVECAEATYVGQQATSTTEEVEVEPTYSGCTALSGFAAAGIDMNGCKYKFTKPKPVVGQPTTFTSEVDIVCPAGKEITVTATSFGTTKCVVHIPPQNGLGTITYHLEGSGTTRTVRTTVAISNKIKYKETKGTGFGACTEGEAENGSYTGDASLTGEHGSPATHTGIWIS